MNHYRKNYCGSAAASGFLRTRITESPLRNILAINLSLLTGFAFFFPEKKNLAKKESVKCKVEVACKISYLCFSASLPSLTSVLAAAARCLGHQLHLDLLSACRRWTPCCQQSLAAAAFHCSAACCSLLSSVAAAWQNPDAAVQRFRSAAVVYRSALLSHLSVAVVVCQRCYLCRGRPARARLGYLDLRSIRF